MVVAKTVFLPLQSLSSVVFVPTVTTREPCRGRVPDCFKYPSKNDHDNKSKDENSNKTINGISYLVDLQKENLEGCINFIKVRCWRF